MAKLWNVFMLFFLSLFFQLNEAFNEVQGKPAFAGPGMIEKPSIGGDKFDERSERPQYPMKWKSLVGTDANYAAEVIKKENTNVKTVQILKAGSPVTMDYRTDRVRIFVDENKQVLNAPRIG
eukprot:CAMPEP_0114390306 /NCGR_PEP_ID=MMETSP0102-20121206/9274_1 /TAXON_ID=38822 ORGANISM="Pteridomonas danica, Strain PT" /NCGR_SAMPLE_ID=MMETSP0102 /ASSEMBLY_ACC=CAM_ASM_000212 /LENGTH=121 /DNA_ID=CAMNT_0001548569 /DNA_START=21 /DNA_END=386 /DNA_ORIENTATION=-